MQPGCDVLPVTLLVYILFCTAFFPTCTVDAVKNKTAKTTEPSKIKATLQPNQEQYKTFVPCHKREVGDSGCLHGASCLVKYVSGQKKTQKSNSKSSVQTASGGFVYKCMCAFGFKGSKCEKAVCQKEVCNKRGKCRLTKGSKSNTTHQCDCEEPYGGQFCEKKLNLNEADEDLMIRENCEKGDDCRHGQCKEVKKVRKDLEKDWDGTKYKGLLATFDELATSKFVCYCEPGYDGPYCSKKCAKSLKRYGSWCNKKCSENCKRKTCDAETGLCSPCERGWGGPRCNEKLLCDKSTCVHGECVDDYLCLCDAGFYKATCDTPCRKRTDLKRRAWGENCEELCGYCIIPQCDEATGFCKPNKKGEYCSAGWGGKRCDQRKGEVEVEGEMDFTANSLETALQSVSDWSLYDDTSSISSLGEEDAPHLQPFFSDDNQNYDADNSEDTNVPPLRTRILTSVQNWFQQASARFSRGDSGSLRRLNIRRRSSDTGNKRKRRQDSSPTLAMAFTMGYPAEAVSGVNIKEELASGLIAEKDSFDVPGLSVNVNSIRINSVEQRDGEEGAQFPVALTLAVGLCAGVLLLLAAATVYKYRRNRKKTHHNKVGSVHGRPLGSLAHKRSSRHRSGSKHSKMSQSSPRQQSRNSAKLTQHSQHSHADKNQSNL